MGWFWTLNEKLWVYGSAQCLAHSGQVISCFGFGFYVSAYKSPQDYATCHMVVPNFMSLASHKNKF